VRRPFRSSEISSSTGAHWSGAAPTEPVEIIPVSADAKITDADRQFWSFVPPRPAPLPQTRNTAWPHTDIDRIVVLSDGVMAGDRDDGTLDAASLLRQLVYLPQASIFVAETQRVVVGGAVLALRPSVRARGFVGTIDLMVVDPDHDADRVTDALLEELIRSASNKGCTLVEASRPDDPDAAERWTRQGFSPAGPRIQRLVTVAGRATRRA